MDPDFQASIDEVYQMTILDTARLANLWQLCRVSNPNGAIIEVGSYKGGSALHLSNSSPNRHIFVCDTFEGFGALPIDRKLDRLFHPDGFSDVDFASVQSAWAGKGRNVTFIKGYFPQSATNTDIRDISFAHIDVDLYQSVADTLEFLLDRFLDQSIIVFDDYMRGAEGLMKAVREFESEHRDWISFPIYPGQGMMINRNWF